MMMLRVVFGLAGLTLLVAIIWAVTAGDFMSEGSVIAASAWGRVTLIDLYAGFLLAGAAMIVIEPNKGFGVGLALATLVLGNVLTAAWLVWRAPLIARRLGVGA